MITVLRRLGRWALSLKGFLWIMVPTAVLFHTAIAAKGISFRLWGRSGPAAWLGFFRDIIGMGDIRHAILEVTVPVQSLSLRQRQFLQAAYHFPVDYRSLLRAYLGGSVAFFFLAGRFLYQLTLHPLATMLADQPNTPAMRMPQWAPHADQLELVVGLQHNERSTGPCENPRLVRLGLHSLRTGMIVTGTTGTGKTYGALYSFTRQFLHFRPDDPGARPGFLILDVKGNYCDQVLRFAEEAGRADDIIIIELGGDHFYNPLHKPGLRPQVLANRLRVILETFSAGKTHDSYWLDKAEAMIAESLKLARLLNGGYVTFRDIDRLIRLKEYRQGLETLRQRSAAGLLNGEDCEALDSAAEFFALEFDQFDERVRSIIESEVTRMTGTFTSDPLVMKTFCASREKLNFVGFDEVIDRGRIVVLRMNAEEYQNLAKIMSTYLKLDFQSAVMTRLVRPGADRSRPVIFINDEYHFLASRTDGRFFSVCREANCINIVATQSYTSLVESLGDKAVVETILQNLVNKIWLRSDDHYTIEMAQRATGREIQFRRSESLTESGKDSSYSWMFGRSVAKNSNLSKSVSFQPVEDHVFAYDLFRRRLKTLTGVAFLFGAEPRGADSEILTTVLHLVPFDRLPLGMKRPSEKMRPESRQAVEAAAISPECPPLGLPERSPVSCRQIDPAGRDSASTDIHPVSPVLFLKKADPGQSVQPDLQRPKELLPSKAETPRAEWNPDDIM